jgi:dTDP-4-dehydrorhamnose reductase
LRILITGAGGMVGRALVEHCTAAGDEVIAQTRAQLDITDASAVEQVLLREQPQVVVNCAAWTDVDGCELDSPRAFAVNARAVETLAVASRRIDAAFITISTDYVFDGEKAGFYTQRDHPNPISIYGQAKLEGERRATAEYARSIIVRTGWIFGASGSNFLSTVVERTRRGERLKAINDMYGIPTYTPHLVARLRELADLDLPGTYHIVGGGQPVSFDGFAGEAFALSGGTEANASLIESVSINSLHRPAPRPRNSCLRCLLSEAIGLAPLPAWKSALREFAAKHQSTIGF